MGPFSFFKPLVSINFTDQNSSRNSTKPGSTGSTKRLAGIYIDFGRICDVPLKMFSKLLSSFDTVWAKILYRFRGEAPKRRIILFSLVWDRMFIGNVTLHTPTFLLSNRNLTDNVYQNYEIDHCFTLIKTI